MPNIVAQLAIVLTDDGRVSVNGPIENKMLVYGLLEMARDAIFLNAQKAEKRIVELPPGTHLKAVPPNGQG